MPDETRAVRESEALDRTALGAYLRDRLPQQPAFVARYGGAALEQLAVEQFPGGHSNLTYLLRFGDLELVLRRPPLGPVPVRAHDMAREARWLAALHPLFPLAPMPLLVCEDPAVLGSVFYVMERRSGLVVRHEEPPAVAGHEAVRRGISETLVDTLVALHALDATAGPLAALGKPAGFVARQVNGWTDRWNLAKTSDLPDMEAVAAWLGAHLPPEPDRPAVVHGDFKLDNVILEAARPTQIVGVLDWEMCALGDPLVDLGIFLGYWLPTTDGESSDALTTVTDRPGWLSRGSILERYGRRSGRDLGRIGFYETFAVFKLAVILQQIYVRYVRGQTDDARFGALGARVTRLARKAADLAAGAG